MNLFSTTPKWAIKVTRVAKEKDRHYFICTKLVCLLITSSLQYY